MTSHWGRSLQTTARAVEKDCPKLSVERNVPKCRVETKAPQSERTAGLMKRG